MDKIKVAIVEDIAEISDSVKKAINQEADMVCDHAYQNAEDAMNFIVHQEIDIMIVDIGLPRASGIDAIKYLSERCPHIQFCMFTVYEDDDKIFHSLKNGAKGYILKNAPKDKIITAIRELHFGGSPMSPTIARRIIDVFQNKEILTVRNDLPLTPREYELLTLLSQGQLYKEIADLLGITIGTVKQHIHKIYEKLQVTNKVEAINLLKKDS